MAYEHQKLNSKHMGGNALHYYNSAADALATITARTHDLLDVQVLQRQRVDVGRRPTLCCNLEFSFPNTMRPFGVHVADSFHLETE